MTTITIRMPEDVIEDLKRIAPLFGFSGYQPLARTYIGQGLRADLERLEADTLPSLIANLKHRGVSEKMIKEAINEAMQRRERSLVLGEGASVCSVAPYRSLM